MSSATHTPREIHIYHSPLVTKDHRVLVLPVQRVEHFNDHKYRQSHGHGVRFTENVAVNAWEHPGLSWALHVVSLWWHAATNGGKGGTGGKYAEGRKRQLWHATFTMTFSTDDKTIQILKLLVKKCNFNSIFHLLYLGVINATKVTRLT